jgi:hypothetical protein
MWDHEGLAHRMTLGQVLDAWSEDQYDDGGEEEAATETEKPGGDAGGEGRPGATVSFEGAGGGGGSGPSSSSGSSSDEARKGKKESDKERRKRKKQRRQSSQAELKLMAENNKIQRAMEEKKKKKAKQLQEDTNQIKRDRASELPRIDGVVHLARKSLRLFTAAADLGGHTAAETVARVQHQTEKLEKKAAKRARVHAPFDMPPIA